MSRRAWIAALASVAVAVVAVAALDDDDDGPLGGGTPCGQDLTLAVATGWDLPAVWVFEDDGGRPVVPGEVSTAASFSPDGSEVVLVRAIGDYESSGPDATELWVLPTSGGDRRLVVGSDSIIGSPDWSPDGTTIAYIDNPGLGYPELRTIPADGDGQPTTIVAIDEVSVGEPAWSPDGGSIAFVSTEGDVGVVSPDGQDQRTVAVVPGAQWVDWSPDGEHLLVSTFAGMEEGALVLVDVQRGGTRELSDQASAASWASDGSVFHFQRSGEDWRLARSTFDGDDLVFDRFLDEVEADDEDAIDAGGLHPYHPVDTTCPD